jgi:molecular chaperone GrpE
MNKPQATTRVEAEYVDPEHEIPQPPNEQQRAQSSGVGADASLPREPSEIEKLKAEREALLDRLARVQAEFENARRRMERAQQEARALAVGETLKTLLPTLDSLELALRSPAPDPKEFRRGVDLIRQQMELAMRSLGLTRIPAEGQLFDPNLHEAVEVVETADARDGEIVEEIHGGFKLGDRLLRPAMVLVARNRAV